MSLPVKIFQNFFSFSYFLFYFLKFLCLLKKNLDFFKEKNINNFLIFYLKGNDILVFLLLIISY